LRELLKAATEDCHLVLLHYYSEQQLTTSRVIEPISLDDYYVFAYCWKRRQVRRFLIGNILKARFTSVDELLPTLQ
jgi:predicted DNA-binding transcriptional regulator YafY